MSDYGETATTDLLSGEDQYEAEQSGEARLDALDEERFAEEAAEATEQHDEYDEHDDEELDDVGTEPEPQRDIQAVMEASDYVRHGCSTMRGGSRSVCICPKAPCGGVAAGDEDYDCPEHGMYDRREYLHWASECPGPYTPAVTPPQ